MALDFSSVKAITIPDGEVKQITDSSGNILWKANTGFEPVVVGVYLTGGGGNLKITSKIISGCVSGGSITISPIYGVGSKTSTYSSYTYSNCSTVFNISTSETTVSATGGTYDVWYINSTYPFKIRVYGNTGWGTVTWTISPTQLTSMSTYTWYYFTLTPKSS